MSTDTARNITIKQTVDNIRTGSHVNSNSGVWTWLGTRRPSSSPDQIGASGSPVENHYTHMMDETYSPEPTDEALYAELDRESIRSGNPSYQNTAYSQCGEVVPANFSTQCKSFQFSSFHYFPKKNRCQLYHQHQVQLTTRTYRPQEM